MRKTIAIVFLAVLAAVSAAAQSREARTIKYAAKDIVLIKAKLRYTTLIVLPQNEKILDFVTGDKDFWVVEGTQNFCYIKPAKQGSNTDVTLITAAGNVYSFLVKEIGMLRLSLCLRAKWKGCECKPRLPRLKPKKTNRHSRPITRSRA